MEIVGIVLGVTAIGLFIWLKKDQQIINDFLESDVKGIEKAYMAFQDDFTNYQIETDRKIIQLEKNLEHQNNKFNKRIDKNEKELP